MIPLWAKQRQAASKCRPHTANAGFAGQIMGYAHFNRGTHR